MVCTACIGYLHILLVWAIVFIRYKAMREAPLKDKGSKVPTPLFYTYCFLWELGGAKQMKDEKTSAQFFAGTIPVPGSAPVPAHAGSRGLD